MRGFDTRYIRGADLVPISWERAQAILKPKAAEDDYLVAAFFVLSQAALVFAAMQKRARPEAMSAICTIWEGLPFIVAAVRKQDLPPADYAALVSCLTGVESVIENGCVDVLAPPWAMEAAREMVVDLLADPRDLLAMAA